MVPLPKPVRLSLPQVTLCAVTSVNVAATLRALESCIAQIEFASCKLFTHAAVEQSVHPAIQIVPIRQLTSSLAYSDYMLNSLIDHVETSHCLVVQWDGHVISADKWRWDFLDYDYIGASWPQFPDGHDVGNGGFSLRSSRLMRACRSEGFIPRHPEDIAIGRLNRTWLEQRGMRFAPRALADIFSTERAGAITASFGYHGVWNMPEAIGIEGFWQRYRHLDERSTIWTDYFNLIRQVARGSHPVWRGFRMTVDRLFDALIKPIR
ncbi:DUF5672 family protein [Sphingomonas sp.]|uniref:DUF5672 family protein n=1 Tax=Sphingomonas sp. TaxID=28214 RepID=UPI0028B0CA2C|nr:DUF5672 family protein [Sphingomonas sp.]